MLPTKFQVNWPFGSGGEAKKVFSRWRPCLPSWSLVLNEFSYFLSKSHLVASNKVSSQFGLSVQEKKQTNTHKKKNDFSSF